MSLFPCDCCAAPACSASWSVTRQSRAVSKSKCGEQKPHGADPNKYWLKITYSNEEDSTEGPLGCTGIFCPSRVLSYTYNSEFEIARTYDPSIAGCPFEWSGSGSNSSSQSRESCLRSEEGAIWWHDSSSSNSSWTLNPDGSKNGTSTTFRTYTQNVNNPGPFFSPCLEPGSTAGTTSSGPTTVPLTDSITTAPTGATVEYSEEYTAEMLADNAESDLAELPWSSPSSSISGTLASRSLTSNGVTLALSESKYTVKLTAIDAAFCKAKLEWIEYFYPTGGGARVAIATRSIDWTKSGKCSPGDGPYEKESDEFTVNVPDNNGTVSLSDFKLTCEGVVDSES